MKLFIQIPCLNEADALGSVLEAIPKVIVGVDEQYSVVINDASTDNTVEVAERYRVDYILSNAVTLGLGTSFRLGLEHAYRAGADILVNTDGDNQYPSRYIPELIQPIIDGRADIVIGNRQTSKVPHFSLFKKSMQWLGTRLLSILIGESNIKDAVSGFRAYNRKSMIDLNVTSTFSYVLDTTIQAKMKGLRIVSVDIITNPPTRPSRLFRNNFHHIRKSAMDIIRVYAMYKGMRFFFWIGVLLLLIGMIPMVRFAYDYFLGAGGEGKIQSLIIGSTFIMSSVMMFALGIIADLLSKNRTLIERVLNYKKDQL